MNNPAKIRRNVILVGLFCVIALPVTLFAFWNFGQSPDVAPIPDHGAAASACHEFVQDRLKAPSTAKFQNSLRENYQQIGAGEFVVTSYVDASNSFGAMIRTAYTCQVKYQNNTWSLVSLQLK